jgi:subtilisin
MPTKKRYLVTHSDTNQSVSPVAQILNIPVENVKTGISFLATDAILQDQHVLEFPNVGITSASLDEGEVKKLRESTNILAVEEDVEMFILEVSNAAMEKEQKAEAHPNGGEVSEAYRRGFEEGLQQYLDSLGQGYHVEGQQQGFMQQPQQLPLPKLPIPIPFPLPHQAIPWNINMVNAPRAWARGITGLGIRVAVLDTGIAAHSDLNPISGGISFVPGVVSFNDGNSHGTHCSGIAAARNNFFGVVGVAPSASLFAVKVLSDAGNGSSSWIIAGMDWAAANGMHVVSMSLGGLSAPLVAYASAVKRLQDRGTVVVIASGNSFQSQNPAFPWVNAPGNSIIVGSPNASPIAVGAIDMSKVIAPFSSRGGQTPVWNQVTVVAPGVNINSTIPGNIYGVKSGTSMATPHVAGAAALLKQRFPGISPALVKLKLMSTATDLGLGGYDITYGSGLINCDKATL